MIDKEKLLKRLEELEEESRLRKDYAVASAFRHINTCIKEGRFDVDGEIL